MLKRVIYLALVLIIISSCNGAIERKTLNEKFDLFENIVSGSNWQKIQGKDTTYLYFSRTGKLDYMTYDFQVKNGDSLNSGINRIFVSGDSVCWNWQEKNLFLMAIDSNGAKWGDKRNNSEYCIVQKKDSGHLVITYPGQPEILLKRTLPLSIFLVRSRYDFLHGTSTVDSAEVPPRELKRK